MRRCAMGVRGWVGLLGLVRNAPAAWSSQTQHLELGHRTCLEPVTGTAPPCDETPRACVKKPLLYPQVGPVPKRLSERHAACPMPAASMFPVMPMPRASCRPCRPRALKWARPSARAYRW